MIIYEKETKKVHYIRVCDTPEEIMSQINTLASALYKFCKNETVDIPGNDIDLRQMISDDLKQRIDNGYRGPTYIHIPSMTDCALQRCDMAMFTHLLLQILADIRTYEDFPVYLSIDNAAAGDNVIIETVSASIITRRLHEFNIARAKLLQK